MTDQTAPKPIATRAAEWWSTLSPAINQSIIVIVTAAVTLIMTFAGQRYAAAPAPKLTIPVALPDLPKPVPMVAIADVDHALALHCGAIKEGLQTLLDRTAPKAVMKKTSGKK